MYKQKALIDKDLNKLAKLSSEIMTDSLTQWQGSQLENDIASKGIKYNDFGIPNIRLVANFTWFGLDVGRVKMQIMNSGKSGY